MWVLSSQGLAGEAFRLGSTIPGTPANSPTARKHPRAICVPRHPAALAAPLSSSLAGSVPWWQLQLPHLCGVPELSSPPPQSSTARRLGLCCSYY